MFYCYVSETQMTHSQSGVNVSQSENATVNSVANAFRYGESKWNNNGLSTWWAIRWYCLDNGTIYPDYAGIQESTRYTGLF